MLLTQAQSLKAAVASAHAAVLELHRRGGDAFSVVRRLTEEIDAILIRVFTDTFGPSPGDVALLAVGGYGRSELCPQSDIDILILRQQNGTADERIKKLVTLLWDGGFQLGHAVRTPDECFQYMKDDLSTANTMLESRPLAGSPRLLARFETQALLRYRRTRRNAFTTAKLDLLRCSIEDPQRTIYVVEPNLKEGVCGLRDIQRVLWIENLQGQGKTFEALLTQGRFSPGEVEALRQAYAFYLRVRCELHFTHKVRVDILERDLMPTIARGLGYGGDGDDQVAVERFLGEHYRHARNVLRFLRFYLETDTRGRSVFERFVRWFRARNVRPNLSLYKGRLYLTSPPAEPVIASTLIDLFVVAQETGAQLSESLCDWVRRELALLDDDFAHAPEAVGAFRTFLRGRGVGRLLKTMHATGLLARLLPEFGKLDCLVNFDGHHQFTVDEHTLKTLEELDRLEEDPDYPEPDFRAAHDAIKDKLPLRLALLLHDVGKAVPGPHSVSGTEAATLICERLGLDARVIETVDFLVYRHLELYRVSTHRDFSEGGVIDGLARLVGSEERLRMLYLLTYIDIVSVGPGTWTRWKGAQLTEVYQRTLSRLRTGALPPEDLQVLLSAMDLGPADRERVAEHCRKMGTPGYVRDILPERMLAHVGLVEAFLAGGEMQVEAESFVGYHDITFCGQDRPRLFADLAGVLFSEGFNLLGARIYSRLDGVVIDIFQVEIADTVTLSVDERVARLRKKLRRIEGGQDSVEGFIEQRTKTYRLQRWHKPLFGPSVNFDNESSAACTVIEVGAGDRPGLLYDLASALHRLGLDVRTAKVSTLMDRAHDVFYVVDAEGRKLEGTGRRNEVSQALLREAAKTAVGAGSGAG